MRPFRIILPVLMLVLIGGIYQKRCHDTPQPVGFATRQDSVAARQDAGSNESDGGQRTEPEIDSTNRYPTAVMVTTNALMIEGGEVECSGVLIAPRVVLTAAGCVCTKRQTGGSYQAPQDTIDSSGCVESTGVTFALYETSARGQGLRTTSVEYSGRVHPHPLFKMTLSGDGRRVSSTADLAIIVLDSSIKGVLPPRLAETEASVGEVLLTVGYPRDIAQAGLHRKRRIGKGEVVSNTSAHEGVLLMRHSTWRADVGMNGGPCLRETPGGPILAGIVRAEANQDYSITSILPYREWVLEQILQAAVGDN